MVFLHPHEDKVILMFSEKLMFLLRIKGIQKYFLILEMSNQGFLILVSFKMIYVFAGIQNACHLGCPLRIAIAT